MLPRTGVLCERGRRLYRVRDTRLDPPAADGQAVRPPGHIMARASWSAQPVRHRRRTEGGSARRVPRRWQRPPPTPTPALRRQPSKRLPPRARRCPASVASPPPTPSPSAASPRAPPRRWLPHHRGPVEPVPPGVPAGRHLADRYRTIGLPGRGGMRGVSRRRPETGPARRPDIPSARLRQRPGAARALPRRSGHRAPQYGHVYCDFS